VLLTRSQVALKFGNKGGAFVVTQDLERLSTLAELAPTEKVTPTVSKETFGPDGSTWVNCFMRRRLGASLRQLPGTDCWAELPEGKVRPSH